MTVHSQVNKRMLMHGIGRNVILSQNFPMKLHRSTLLF